ncbi:hypothetical protein DQT32_03320 [Salmonella enterica subsp. enterica serovar Braenderup]|nr:hypothetical protein [Salmonella enterica subsp. enterica serovar Braenderup]
MGLDISAYKNIQKEELKGDYDDERYDRAYEQNWVEFYTHNQPDVFQHEDIDGDYFYSSPNGRLTMRAGSYGGYSTWRGKLSHLASSLPKDADGNPPFIELLQYSDCEGVIGAKCSAKLANDFAIYELDARQALDDYSFAKYKEWRDMFEYASDNGAVKFH